MTTKAKEELETICRIVTETVDPEKIILFGSYAYGTPNRESDYDLCVVIQDDNERPVDAVKRIRRALLPIQTPPLDVIVYHKRDFEERQQIPSFERRIARDGILLYGKA